MIFFLAFFALYPLSLILSLSNPSFSSWSSSCSVSVCLSLIRICLPLIWFPPRLTHTIFLIHVHARSTSLLRPTLHTHTQYLTQTHLNVNKNKQLDSVGERWTRTEYGMRLIMQWNVALAHPHKHRSVVYPDIRAFTAAAAADCAVVVVAVAVDVCCCRLLLSTHYYGMLRLNSTPYTTSTHVYCVHVAYTSVWLRMRWKQDVSRTHIEKLIKSYEV